MADNKKFLDSSGLEYLIEKIKTIFQSKLKYYIEDPVENQEGWEITTKDETTFTSVNSYFGSDGAEILLEETSDYGNASLSVNDTNITLESRDEKVVLGYNYQYSTEAPSFTYNNKQIATIDDIPAVEPSDWNENDSTKNDYIKNRTHWVEDDVEFKFTKDDVNYTQWEYDDEAGYNIIIDGYFKLNEEVTLSLNGNEVGSFALSNEQDDKYFWTDTITDSTSSIQGFIQFENDYSDHIGYVLYFSLSAIPDSFVLSGKYHKVNKINEQYYDTSIGKNGTGWNGEIFNSYAENEASGSYSHAEGLNTVASGYSAHAEGIGAIASGNRSHAEGGFTTASGDYSHAENYSTTANGHYAHADGRSTTASGDASHAEGWGVTANGDASHAEGDATIATADSSHAQGKYNIEDTSNTYADIVGNGTDEKRSNASTLDWSGNAWFAGDVYVGSTSGTNKDEGSVKLAKSTEIPTKVSELTNDSGYVTTDTDTTYTFVSDTNGFTVTPSGGSAQTVSITPSFETVYIDISDVSNYTYEQVLAMYNAGKKIYVIGLFEGAYIVMPLEKVYNDSITFRTLYSTNNILYYISSTVKSGSTWVSSLVFEEAYRLNYGNTLPTSGTEGKIFFVLEEE